MELLERSAEHSAFLNTLDRVRQGYGSIILVSGEAGVGKTSFVAEAVASLRPAGRVYWGACDPLFTPRPLGPLYDIARQEFPGLLDLLNQNAVWFDVALRMLEALLDNPAPTIVVIEDIHWADEATLDLLKYLARRIDQTHTLLLLTYRDDEVGRQHLLSQVLGNFPADHTFRLPLQPLSAAAVAELAARAGRPVEGIYQATRGNPFFVTEVLRSREDRLPETVRDAVLARMAYCSPQVRDVLELAALVPGPIQPWLIEHILEPEAGVIDACIEGGFFIPSGSGMSFRHELARQAIAESLPFTRSRTLYMKILQAFEARPDQAPLALWVHLAVGAENEKMVLAYAPRAAREASHHGAHREAARHFQTALNYRQALPLEQQADLLDEISFEYYLTGRIDQAIRMRTEAIQSWRAAGRTERIGDDLRWLSRLYWFQGNKQEADRFAAEAIATLEQLPPAQELAMAYSNRSQLYMLAEDSAAAIAWGQQALKIAQDIHADEISVHALTNIGTAELFSGLPAGYIKLDKALQIALRQEMHDHVARCYANLASFSVMQREYPRAAVYLRQGIAYTSDRDMDSYSVYLRGWQARLRFEQGDWAEALQEAEEVLRLNPGSAVMALPALTTLGYIKMRQGDPQAGAWLDQAMAMAQATGELQRLGPVAAARAEAAWWKGDLGQVLAETSQVYEISRRSGDMWQLGQMMVWIQRAGGEAYTGDISPERIPLCYRAEIEGDWQAAAAEWERIGCPYEQALALSAGGSQAQLQALARFEQLESQPAAAWLRERMRSQGLRGVPRGARPATKANPEGLTNREVEILELLVAGKSNAEISRDLSIAIKTVDHHVSMVLAKLNVHSRLEAAAVARQKNLFPQKK